MTSNPKPMPPHMKTFLARVDQLIKEFHLEDDRGFDRHMGWTNKLYRWREGIVTGFTLRTLMEISHKFNKSLDWLLLVDEGASSLQEHRAIFYEYRPAPPVDAPLLTQVIGRVEEVLLDKKIKMPSTKRARLITLLYEHCGREKEPPNRTLIERYLLLAD